VQNPPQRRRDLPRREHAGGDLVEKRLKGMVVLAIHQRDLDRLARQGLRGIETTEPTTNDYHPDRLLSHRPPTLGTIQGR